MWPPRGAVPAAMFTPTGYSQRLSEIQVSCRFAFYLFPDVLKTAAGGICIQLFSWFITALRCARASYSGMRTERTFPSSLSTCSVFDMTPPGGGSSNETKHDIQQKSGSKTQACTTQRVKAPPL